MLSDFRIEIVGTQATAIWHTPWGFDAELLSNVVEMLGSESSLFVERVRFSSGGVVYDAAHGAYAGQAVGGMIVWSFSRPKFLTKSTLVVADCTFQGAGGISTYNIDKSQVFVVNNRFQILENGTAWFISDVRHSNLYGSRNRVMPLGQGVTNISGWAGNIGTGITSSRLLFVKNFLAGAVGITFTPGIFKDVKCRAVHNFVSKVSNPYVFDETTPCEVVGGGRSDR